MTSGPTRGEWKRLVDLLLRLGIVERGDLLRAVATAKQTGSHLTRVLVDQALVDEDRLTRALGSALGIESVTPATMKIHERVLGLIPSRVALRMRALPIAIKRANQTDYLYVALADPLDAEVIEELRQITGCQVSVLVAPPTQLDAALQRFYGAGSDRPAETPRGASIPPPQRSPVGGVMPARVLPGLPEGYVVAPPPPARGAGTQPGAVVSAGLPAPSSPPSGLPRPSGAAPAKPRAQLPSVAPAAPTSQRGLPVPAAPAGRVAVGVALPSFPPAPEQKTVPLAAGKLLREANEARTLLDTNILDMLPSAQPTVLVESTAAVSESRSALETARPSEARRGPSLPILSDAPTSAAERAWEIDIDVDAPPLAARVGGDDDPVDLDDIFEEDVELGLTAHETARPEPLDPSREAMLGHAHAPSARIVASSPLLDDPDEATSQLDIDEELRLRAELDEREPRVPPRVVARTLELPVAPREAPSPFDAMRGVTLSAGLEKTGIIPALQWDLEAFDPAPDLRRASPHLAGADDIPGSPHEVLARLDGDEGPASAAAVDVPLHDDVVDPRQVVEETIGPTTDPRQEDAAILEPEPDRAQVEPGLIVTGRRSEPAPGLGLPSPPPSNSRPELRLDEDLAVEPPRPVEPARVEGPVTVRDAPRPEALRPDASRLSELPRTELPRVEAIRVEASRPDLLRPEPLRSRPDALRGAAREFIAPREAPAREQTTVDVVYASEPERETPPASLAPSASVEGPLDVEASKLVDALLAGDTLTSPERAQLVLAVARALLASGVLSREQLVRALASL
jgi:hypothetical protein